MEESGVNGHFKTLITRFFLTPS